MGKGGGPGHSLLAGSREGPACAVGTAPGPQRDFPKRHVEQQEESFGFCF